MMRLEDIKAGALIQGIEPGEVVCAVMYCFFSSASIDEEYTLQKRGK